MVNLTDYNDQFILDLIKQVKGNPYKCTANVQYAVGFNKLIPILVIYQDCSIDWDDEYSTIFYEKVDAVDFCDDNHISIGDLHTMQEYYDSIAIQKSIEDIEYEQECEEYERALYEEYSWYIHARQMGWE
jgi:hypothetical protein